VPTAVRWSALVRPRLHRVKTDNARGSNPTKIPVLAATSQVATRCFADGQAATDRKRRRTTSTVNIATKGTINMISWVMGSGAPNSNDTATAVTAAAINALFMGELISKSLGVKRGLTNDVLRYAQPILFHDFDSAPC
jgi:hypothetical protein